MSHFSVFLSPKCQLNYTIMDFCMIRTEVYQWKIADSKIERLIAAELPSR